MKKILFLLVLVFGYCNNIRCIHINKEEILKQTKQEDVYEKNMAYLNLAAYYKWVEGKDSEADSICLKAIEIAEEERNKNLMALVYMQYSNYCLPTHFNQAEKYLQKSISLAQKLNSANLEFDAMVLLSQLYKNMGKTSEAFRTLGEAKKFIQQSNEKEFLYHLANGEIGNETKDLQFTLSNYYAALGFAHKAENDSMKLEVYKRIIKFSLKNQYYSKADAFIDSSKDLFKGSKAFNEYDKLFIKSYEQKLHAYTNKEALLKNGFGLLAEMKKNKFYFLENDVYSNLRLSFMKHDDIKSLCTLYCDTPHNKKLNELFYSQPDMFYRIKALINENEGKIDSAKAYWKVSEIYLDQVKNIPYRANFYLRYGQFHIRQKNNSAAVALFKKSYDYAKIAGYLPMITESGDKLERTYYDLGDLGNAYSILKQQKSMMDSTHAELLQEKLAALDQNSKQEISLIHQSNLEEKEERKYLLQLYLIGSFGILMFYGLIVVSKKSISVEKLKLMGYITFIFIFEFLIFLLHNVFHSITHSPIWLMLMNVTLIAILLPIHHASEHHFIHYLIQKQRIKHSNTTLWQQIVQQFTRFRNWLKIEKTEHQDKDQNSI